MGKHAQSIDSQILQRAKAGRDGWVFTPEFLLDQAGRHTAYTQADLDRLHLRAPLDLRELKRDWLAALDEARRLTNSLPPDEIGCLYLGPRQDPVNPEPSAAVFQALTRHRGSIRGAWPLVTPYSAV